MPGSRPGVSMHTFLLIYVDLCTEGDADHKPINLYASPSRCAYLHGQSVFVCSSFLRFHFSNASRPGRNDLSTVLNTSSASILIVTPQVHLTSSAAIPFESCSQLHSLIRRPQNGHGFILCISIHCSFPHMISAIRSIPSALPSEYCVRQSFSSI